MATACSASCRAASGVRSMPLAKPQAPSCTTRTASPRSLSSEMLSSCASRSRIRPVRMRSSRKSACSAPSSVARPSAASARAEAGRARKWGSRLGITLDTRGQCAGLGHPGRPRGPRQAARHGRCRRAHTAAFSRYADARDEESLGRATEPDSHRRRRHAAGGGSGADRTTGDQRGTGRGPSAATGRRGDAVRHSRHPFPTSRSARSATPAANLPRWRYAGPAPPS